MARVGFMQSPNVPRLLARCDRVLRLRDGRILPENAALQAA